MDIFYPVSSYFISENVGPLCQSDLVGSFHFPFCLFLCFFYSICSFFLSSCLLSSCFSLSAAHFVPQTLKLILFHITYFKNMNLSINSHHFVLKCFSSMDSEQRWATKRSTVEEHKEAVNQVGLLGGGVLR